jgi:hypothetical protein
LTSLRGIFDLRPTHRVPVAERVPLSAYRLAQRRPHRIPADAEEQVARLAFGMLANRWQAVISIMVDGV